MASRLEIQSPSGCFLFLVRTQTVRDRVGSGGTAEVNGLRPGVVSPQHPPSHRTSIHDSVRKSRNRVVEHTSNRGKDKGSLPLVPSRPNPPCVYPGVYPREGMGVVGVCRPVSYEVGYEGHPSGRREGLRQPVPRPMTPLSLKHSMGTHYCLSHTLCLPSQKRD